MKVVYRVWLLSRDERVLKILCLACVGLAALSFLIAGFQPGPPSGIAPATAL